ncbi:MAG: 4-amino-4-deoxy-L-arabinose-phospho-UDP flippase [Alphaproteobacteria bacterium]
MIASGQVLFKGAAEALASAGTALDTRVVGLTVLALAIYGAATLLWIALLRDAALSRLYPYMALSFVLVAAAGRVIFAEPLVPTHILGLGLIVGGIVLIAAS